jgi:F-type H+-transporting ATPase subunit delta
VSRCAVARSYGRAIFEAAREAGTGERVRAEADALAEALRTDLQPLLLSPKVPLATRLAIVAEIFAGTSPLFLSWLSLVIRKGRAGALAEMVQVLRDLEDAAAGRAVGELRTAAPLSEELGERIRGTMARLTGTELRLRQVQDPELLGGFVARVGNQLLDLSLRTRLDRLRRHLLAG